MGELPAVGRLLIISGVVLAGLGLLLTVAPRVPGLNRLGRLPGDIFIERGTFTLFVPLVSSIVISLLLTIIVNVILRR